VARSFAGDPKQLVALLKGAISHRGTALIDVISPCVTFNNHPGSTKSYDYAKEHEELLHEVGFIPYFEPITVDYDEGTTRDVVLHDGSHIRLKKLTRDYDPMSRLGAMRMLEETRENNEFLTGLIYVNPITEDFVTLMNLVDEPLSTLPQDKVRPSKEALDEIMSELM
jgi:2-oxoglutarate ferredoxin oxidoreductase subunit beta